jgi:hypothetical protein
MSSYDDVINMSYGYFQTHTCTHEAISNFLDNMRSWIESSGLDREALYDELTRRHTVRIFGDDAILDCKGDHEDWFNAASGVGLSRDITWHFWDHYQRYLVNGKHWPKEVVSSLDMETNKILSRLEDPQRSGQWDRRGMVIGSVQSGKTANYTGVIAKAIDSGYKLIIVLAGVHNSLRSQTQFRLNEEILGYHLDRVQEYNEQARTTGVRKMFPDHRIAQTLTNAGESGDFKKAIAESAGIVPALDSAPIILVVKKHVSILKNLLDWATSIIGKRDSNGRLVVEDIPLLVIDDECDYASVNTKSVIKDENGAIDPECDPAKTNQRIRQLLTTFHKSVYIGYTATPFANIFIHHEDVHPLYGQDLFPRNFILSLPQPSNYIGADRLFGLNENPAAGVECVQPLPLLKHVSDGATVFPSNHKKDLGIATLPDSLKEAIRVFLLCCAARRFRRCSPPHNSMLIHVTRYTLVQSQVHDLVEKELNRCVDRIRSGGAALSEFKRTWEKDFIPTTSQLESEFGCKVIPWSELVPNLYPIAKRVLVKSINGSADDSLDYRTRELEARARIEAKQDVPWEEQGENVISVGGDKLSRGLTLDGLTVSYYLRASKMYDSLMQMGRWFGYRDGYEDMCRIYTTTELSDWYRFIATASTELKNELKYMDFRRKEPQFFGLKVLDHPGMLAVTSAGKRRNSQRLKLSYSGRISATVVFDLTRSKSNRLVVDELVRSADAVCKPESTNSGTFVWKGLSPEIVLTFLDGYRTDDEAAKVVDPDKIAKFIRQQLSHGDNDLTEWTVALVSKGQPEKDGEIRFGSRTVTRSVRTPDDVSETRVTIGTLVNPTDEWLVFSETEKKAAIEEYGRDLTGKEKRAKRIKTKSRGLLLIYPIWENRDGKTPYGHEGNEPVVGFAISFPESDTTIQVDYQVNAVFQAEEDDV